MDIRWGGLGRARCPGGCRFTVDLKKAASSSGCLAATLRVGEMPTLSLDDPDTLCPAERNRRQLSARRANSPVPTSAAFEVLAGLDVRVDANPPAPACLRCRCRSPGEQSHDRVRPGIPRPPPAPSLHGLRSGRGRFVRPPALTSSSTEFPFVWKSTS
jgi:hypothetical protein